MELVVEVVEGIDFAEVGGFGMEEFGLVGAATFGCALGPASIFFRFQKKYKSRGRKTKDKEEGKKRRKWRGYFRVRKMRTYLVERIETER